MASNGGENTVDYEIADIRHSGVNGTAVTIKRSLVNPHSFYVKV
jgi:hypothetical protein